MTYRPIFESLSCNVLLLTHNCNLTFFPFYVNVNIDDLDVAFFFNFCNISALSSRLPKNNVRKIGFNSVAYLEYCIIIFLVPYNVRIFVALTETSRNVFNYYLFSRQVFFSSSRQIRCFTSVRVYCHSPPITSPKG